MSGRERIAARRSVLLLVPAVMTGERDGNAVANPEHADAARIVFSAKAKVVFDLPLPRR